MTETRHNSVFRQDVLHVLLSSHALQHGGHELLSAVEGLRGLVWVLDYPPGEGPEGFGSLVGIFGLLSAPVEAFGEVVLVPAAPDHLQVPMDVNALVVPDAQLGASQRARDLRPEFLSNLSGPPWRFRKLFTAVGTSAMFLP